MSSTSLTSPDTTAPMIAPVEATSSVAIPMRWLTERSASCRAAAASDAAATVIRPRGAASVGDIPVTTRAGTSRMAPPSPPRVPMAAARSAITP